MIATTLSTVLRTPVPLHIVLYSKDLYTGFSTKFRSVDKSICADFNVIRYELERKHVFRSVCIFVKLNLADCVTKADISCYQPLQLKFLNRRLAIYFEGSE